VEEAFLAGLLHDVGRPTLFQAIADLDRSSDPRKKADQASVVDELHAAVGAELATRWALPARVAEAIATHHVPATAAHTELAMLTSLADVLAHQVLEPVSGDLGSGGALGHPALVALNLYPDDLEKLLAGSDALVETVRTLW
jgi:putative nucleotidyltransferase with HDIG domain